MIILFDENETQFDTLGIGVLKDAISCVVEEELNGSFDLEMTYPISGKYYNEIKLRRIIYAKPNKYDNAQAFRITKISEPLNGIITINADHISYDLSGYIINPFDSEAEGIQNSLEKIRENVIGNFPFTLSTDIVNIQSKFNVQTPSSVRSILGGNEGSLLDVFGGEYTFNNFNVILNKTRGSERGFNVIYGKNMKEFTRETKADKLYTDVYPYYYRIVTETESESSNVYQQVYVRESTESETVEPFTEDWLSLNPNSTAFKPLIKKTPVQIASEGDYYQKIYIWDDYETETGEIIEKYIEVTTEEYPPNIPSTTTTSKETTEMVILDEKTIPIEGREEVSPKRILNLDLTQFFDEKPSQEDLKERANKYITDNKIGTVIETVESAFIRITSNVINENYCLLGDYVTVIFQDYGINKNLQVISTTYDVLLDEYESIGLGKKESALTDSSLAVGDDISSLNNDANYTDELRVSELIAKTITADYIKSVNADFSQAQIETLISDNFIANGVIQAAEVSVDTLVAELLTADDAEIKKVLTVGEGLVVNGEINIKSGSIAIVKDNNIEYVDAYINVNEEEYGEHWLKAKFEDTESFTPESDDIIYKVYDENNLWTYFYYHWSTEDNEYVMYIDAEPDVYFEVDDEGNLYANSAEIKGKITATSGSIGGCVIENNVLHVGSLNIDDININDGTFVVTYQGEVTIYSGSISLGHNYDGSYDFSVNDNGEVTIKSGSISLGYVEPSRDSNNEGYYNFTVDNYGEVTIKSGSINLGYTEIPATEEGANPEVYYKFSVNDDGDVDIRSGSISLGYVEKEPEEEGGIPESYYNFTVNDKGEVEIRSGSIDIGNGKFTVLDDGTVKAQSIIIEGGTFSGTNNIYSNEAHIDLLYSDDAEFIEATIDTLHIGKATLTYELEDAIYTTKTGNLEGTLSWKINRSAGLTDVYLRITIDNYIEGDKGIVNVREVTVSNVVFEKEDYSGGTLSRIYYFTNLKYDVSKGYLEVYLETCDFIVKSVVTSTIKFYPYYPGRSVTFETIQNPGVGHLELDDNAILKVNNIKMDNFIMDGHRYGYSIKNSVETYPIAYCDLTKYDAPRYLNSGVGIYSGVIITAPSSSFYNVPLIKLPIDDNLYEDKVTILSFIVSPVFPPDYEYVHTEDEQKIIQFPYNQNWGYAAYYPAGYYTLKNRRYEFYVANPNRLVDWEIHYTIVYEVHYNKDV